MAPPNSMARPNPKAPSKGMTPASGKAHSNDVARFNDMPPSNPMAPCSGMAPLYSIVSSNSRTWFKGVAPSNNMAHSNRMGHSDIMTNFTGMAPFRAIDSFCPPAPIREMAPSNSMAHFNGVTTSSSMANVNDSANSNSAARWNDMGPSNSRPVLRGKVSSNTMALHQGVLTSNSMTPSGSTAPFSPVAPLRRVAQCNTMVPSSAGNVSKGKGPPKSMESCQNVAQSKVIGSARGNAPSNGQTPSKGKGRCRDKDIPDPKTSSDSVIPSEGPSQCNGIDHLNTVPLSNSRDKGQPAINFAQIRRRHDAARAVFKAMVEDKSIQIELKFIELIIIGAHYYAPVSRKSATEIAQFNGLPRALGDDSEIHQAWQDVDFSQEWLWSVLDKLDHRRKMGRKADKLKGTIDLAIFQKMPPGELTKTKTGLMTVEEIEQLGKALDALRSWSLEVHKKNLPEYFQKRKSKEFIDAMEIFVSSFGRFPQAAAVTPERLYKGAPADLPKSYPEVAPSTARKRAWQSFLVPERMAANVNVDEAIVNVWIAHIWATVGEPWLDDKDLIFAEDRPHQIRWLGYAAWPEHDQKGPWDLWSRKALQITEKSWKTESLVATAVGSARLSHWKSEYGRLIPNNPNKRMRVQV